MKSGIRYVSLRETVNLNATSNAFKLQLYSEGAKLQTAVLQMGLVKVRLDFLLCFFLSSATGDVRSEVSFQ